MDIKMRLNTVLKHLNTGPLIVFVFLTMTSEVFSQDIISWPGGRYAITSDGNMHDPDDIGAIPMSIATMCYAGFKDKIVHLDYANHLGLSNPSKLKEITASCVEVAERFKLKREILFDCQTQLDVATKNFVKEGKRSTAEDPLWFICAGPMGTAYNYLEALKQQAPEKLKYIHCVSHSNANNTHNDTPELKGKTWEAMKRDFPEVNFHDMANQNTREGFCSPIENWSWMNGEKAPDNWKWLYGRNRTASVHIGMFDMSDGGMTYWLISGAANGGNQKGNSNDIKAVFNNETKK